MKKITALFTILVSSIFILYACNDTATEEDNLYVLTEMVSNRGNSGYKKGDVTSYSIDLNSKLVYVNEFTEDGFGSDVKEDNTYDLENLEESAEKLSFSFDNRKEIFLKKSDSFYESEITGIQYDFTVSEQEPD